jgi:hypothetical protein
VTKKKGLTTLSPEAKYEYVPAWERIFPWLQKAVDDDWAYCSLCKFPMEPKLSVIKAHLKHRRHLKLVSQQDNPNAFETKADTSGTRPILPAAKADQVIT